MKKILKFKSTFFGKLQQAHVYFFVSLTNIKSFFNGTLISWMEDLSKKVKSSRNFIDMMK